MISDGVETCDGDPVQAAKDLHNSNLNVTVNVIGFDVDQDGRKQLKETAQAGARGRIVETRRPFESGSRAEP